MNRLKDLRKSQNMTQDDLAKILNVNRSVISKYESGSVPLTSDAIIVLTDFFEISSDYLLGRNKKSSLPYDEEVVELMEEMHKRPENKVLFSLGKKAKKEDVEAVNELLKHMIRESGGDIDE